MIASASLSRGGVMMMLEYGSGSRRKGSFFSLSNSNACNGRVGLGGEVIESLMKGRVARRLCFIHCFDLTPRTNHFSESD